LTKKKNRLLKLKSERGGGRGDADSPTSTRAGLKRDKSLAWQKKKIHRLDQGGWPCGHTRKALIDRRIRGGRNDARDSWAMQHGWRTAIVSRKQHSYMVIDTVSPTRAGLFSSSTKIQGVRGTRDKGKNGRLPLTRWRRRERRARLAGTKKKGSMVLKRQGPKNSSTTNYSATRRKSRTTSGHHGRSTAALQGKFSLWRQLMKLTEKPACGKKTPASPKKEKVRQISFGNRSVTSRKSLQVQKINEARVNRADIKTKGRGQHPAHWGPRA